MDEPFAAIDARTTADLLALEHRPKLVIAVASAFSLRIDFERIVQAAKAVGAYFMVDMAHYAGLIAAGVYPNPVPYADFVTTTAHKNLRGPRGGVILMRAEHEKAINSAVFPGLQGGRLMHVIAGKAVAFKEAMSPDFQAYQAQVVRNADELATALTKRGLRIVSGRTESHVMLVDLRAKLITIYDYGMARPSRSDRVRSLSFERGRGADRWISLFLGSTWARILAAWRDRMRRGRSCFAVG